MQWRSELFDACYQIGFQEKTDTLISENEWDFIQIVLFSKENFTFSELEKIKNDPEIYLEIVSIDGVDTLVEHTKLSIIMGIISNYNKGMEFKNKSKSKVKNGKY